MVHTAILYGYNTEWKTATNATFVMFTMLYSEQHYSGKRRKQPACVFSIRNRIIFKRCFHSVGTICAFINVYYVKWLLPNSVGLTGGWAYHSQVLLQGKHYNWKPMKECVLTLKAVLPFSFRLHFFSTTATLTVKAIIHTTTAVMQNRTLLLLKWVKKLKKAALHFTRTNHHKSCKHCCSTVAF